MTDKSWDIVRHEETSRDGVTDKSWDSVTDKSGDIVRQVKGQCDR